MTSRPSVGFKKPRPFLLILTVFEMLKVRTVRLDDPNNRHFWSLKKFGTKVQSGDLNYKHLNNRNICITNFYLFTIQMPCGISLFEP